MWLSIFSFFVIAATLLPMLRHYHWLIRGLDFPRLQIAVIAMATFIGQCFFLDMGQLYNSMVTMATFFCLSWQLWWILPYTRIWKKEVQTAEVEHPAQCITILTANVLTPNRQADKLIELVHQYQPDIVVTLESDQWWEDQLKVLEETMPETIKCPLDNLYGMHVYSRLALHEKNIEFLVEDDVPSMHVLIEMTSGDKVRAHFLHPAPPSPTENPESIERDAELVVVARSVAETQLPVIVTGDLNDVAWSRTTRLFRKLSGLLDPRVGRGMFNTFHAKYPLLRWPLDHLFHSHHFMVKSIERLPSIGSDHFPLLTRLTYTPGNKESQEGLKLDNDDQQFATEIVQEQGVSKNKVPQPGRECVSGGV